MEIQTRGIGNRTSLAPTHLPFLLVNPSSAIAFRWLVVLFSMTVGTEDLTLLDFVA